MTSRDDITQAKQQKSTGDIIALVIRSTWPVGPNYEAWRSHNWTGNLLLLRVCLKIGNYFPGLFNDTSKTAKIIWFLPVLRWAMDVIEVIYYIHGPLDY